MATIWTSVRYGASVSSTAANRDSLSTMSELPWKPVKVLLFSTCEGLVTQSSSSAVTLLMWNT
jgi:hypothetical protein